MNDKAIEASPSEIELGHVLFMDIVGYSQLRNDVQVRLLGELKEIVRTSAEVMRARASGDLISPPAGDGMALVFFGDPAAAARSAMEIDRALRSHPHIKLRMGVHSEPVNRIADINDNPNVAGAGVNMAQRVMDCGDAGHILLSKRVADDLGQYTRWQPYLHDLGEVEVKHGRRIRVVNLYSDEVGNPELPAKFKKRKTTLLPWSAMAAVVLVAGIAGALSLGTRQEQKRDEQTNAGLAQGATAPVSEITITYSLTVQQKVKNLLTGEYEARGAPYESTGQEAYGNGWAFRVNITPAQAGSLYLLNEGPGATGATVYNVLFPTRANNNRVAQLAANQTMRTESYIFDEHTGTEKLWIIWSVKPLEMLNNIFEDAGESELVIGDPRQINAVRDLLARYGSSKPEVMTDETRKQTTIKGTGDVVISLLELQHK